MNEAETSLAAVPSVAERVDPPDIALPPEDGAVSSPPPAEPFDPSPLANAASVSLDPRIENVRRAREMIGHQPDYSPWQPKKLSGRHLVMIEYHLAGHTHREIAKVLGCTEIDVGLIIRSDLSQEYIRGRVDDLNAEFHGLYRKVIDVIDKSLGCEDLEIAQKAADKWLRAHGKYAPKKEDDGRVTAEDIVAKLLERNGSVTLNIDARQQFSYRAETNASP